MRYKISFVFVLFLFLININKNTYAQDDSLKSEAKIFYVSPVGNDNNNGLTSYESFKTINKAISLSGEGDTIFILPGTYNEVIIFKNKKGLPERSISLLGFSNYEEDFPLIDGGVTKPTADSLSFWMLIKNSEWIKIGKLKFKNAWAYPVLIKNSSYITFDSCYFWGGKRVINADGDRTHHLLVENCYWDQGGKYLWTLRKDSSGVPAWLSMHHENMSYFNGSLIDFHKTGGSVVIRNNTIVNSYNAIRWRGVRGHDTNIEIYNNNISYARDNDFEPEYYTYNLHIYHNFSYDIHRTLSVDHVEGGNIYYYGNVITTDNDPWTKQICVNFWKIYGEERQLSYPLFAFNNSFYGTANAFRVDVGDLIQVKHFNNAYYFSVKENGWVLNKWDSTDEFNYDISNKKWPENIVNNNQEKNGKVADIKFVNPAGRDLRLQKDSPGIDAGKVISFSDFDWTQSYHGKAPDVGAYENNELVEGPPFRFLLPPGTEVSYKEKPRIVRSKTNSNKLILFFSEAINSETVKKEDVNLFVNHDPELVKDISFSDHNYKMIIETDSNIKGKDVSISFKKMPVGINGEKVTYWASTIKIEK